jgi:predicted RNase H-like HicB family nuclease
MLLEYLQAALRHAHYEILKDDGTYYGEIPECNGVYANAATLEACREELQEVLEEWVLFRVHRHLPLPVIDSIELTISQNFATSGNFQRRMEDIIV